MPKRQSQFTDTSSNRNLKHEECFYCTFAKCQVRNNTAKTMKPRKCLFSVKFILGKWAWFITSTEKCNSLLSIWQKCIFVRSKLTTFLRCANVKTKWNVVLFDFNRPVAVNVMRQRTERIGGIDLVKEEENDINNKIISPWHYLYFYLDNKSNYRLYKLQIALTHLSQICKMGVQIEIKIRV